MFDFYEKARNGFGFPFSFQGMNTDDDGNTEEVMNPMQFMQQMFCMQMCLAQGMFMMPFNMMKGFADMTGMKGMFAGEDSQAQQGVKVGGFNVPPELLSKLMSIDMSPENLEKLQKLLDFVFAAMPEGKSE